jgi:hypothetical protein
MPDQTTPAAAAYAGLTPDVLLDAVDRCGFQS